MNRWMQKAKDVAQQSNDPSTKVGAVIVQTYSWRDDYELSWGFNHFPRGVKETEERWNDRPTKYSLVIHAEADAIINAADDISGATIYVWPLFTCNECAKLIIQAGIHKVVTLKPDSDRWGSHYETAMMMYKEAGVEVEFLEDE